MSRLPMLLLISGSLLLPGVVLGEPSATPSSNKLPATENSDKGTAPAEQVGETVSNSDPSSRTWYDESHEFVTHQSDNLVRWLDNFFGSPRTDLENAQSFLRLRLESEWDEEDKHSFGQRVRGKVHLPRISNRIGLIFSDERGDETSDGNNLEEALSDEKSANNVALQYTGVDNDRSRLDFKFGLRSSLKVKLAARYRYELPITDRMQWRFSEELYFRDGEGFGSFSRIELDKTFKKDQLFRWSNRAEWGESTDGVEWNTAVSLSRRINEKSALSWFASIEGSTRPGFTNKGYGFGVTYRRNWLRKWLFFELEPAYVWRRRRIEFEGQDPYFLDRDGVARFTARLEIHFGTDQLSLSSKQNSK